jgi:hypothetical protein
MARDAITRQYDVDKNLVTLFCEPGKEGYRPGTITFHAKKGKSIDLDKIHESLVATRLSGGTSMRVDYLELTIRGTVVGDGDKGLILRASGSEEEFILAQAPTAKDELKRLLETVSRGANTVTTVRGRVPGWDGRFPDVLRALAKAPKTRTLLVTGFEIAK